MGIPAPAHEPNSPGLRRWGIAAVLALACWALAGCAANFGAQTNQQYQPAEGISDRDTSVYILNALVVSDGNGNGTLVASLINQTRTPDALQGVSAVDSQGQPIQVTKLQQPITLAAHAAVKLETTGDIRLSGDAVAAGYYVTVTFSFQNAAPVELQIPVVANGPVFSGVPTGPSTATG